MAFISDINIYNGTFKYRSLHPKFGTSKVATTLADLFWWTNLPEKKSYLLSVTGVIGILRRQ
jgi:hypothetical protein